SNTPPPTLHSPLSLHDALPILAILFGIHGKYITILANMTHFVKIFYSCCTSSSSLDGISLSNSKLSTPAFSLILCTKVICSLVRSEEHTSELQSRENLVCRLLL